MIDDDPQAEIARLKAELAKARALSIAPAAEESTEAYYWVNTMRGEQPRCRKCDRPLTRGPKGGVTESFCPSCGAELREGSNASSVERR
jgi:hypothetical protein